MSGNIAILTLTVIAAAALAERRFVEQDGTYPAAGGKAFGVTRFEAAIGDPVSVDVQGTTIVETGAAVALDDALMVDVEGRVVPLAGLSKQAVARSMGVAAATGAFIEILLVPSAGLTTPAA